MSRVATILEAYVPLERQSDLQAAYRDAAGDGFPPGLLRTQLLQDAGDPTLWRIETIWESFEVLKAMRSTGTPKGILMFRAAGVEPTVSAFRVVEEIQAP